MIMYGLFMKDYVKSKKMVNMDLLIKQVVPHSESESMRKKGRISGNFSLNVVFKLNVLNILTFVQARIQQ